MATVTLPLWTPPAPPPRICDEDGPYRYLLGSPHTMPHNTLLWVCLNPSVASATVTDPTMTNIEAFTKRFGFARWEIVNLFAFRATYPSDLRMRLCDRGLYFIVGPRNDEVIKRQAALADRVVVAWGATYEDKPFVRSRVDSVLALLPRPLFCLGRTKGGSPRHPNRLAYSTKLEEFRP